MVAPEADANLAISSHTNIHCILVLFVVIVVYFLVVLIILFIIVSELSLPIVGI